MDYEKEQEYLRQLYDEVRSDSELELEPDDDDDSLADNEVEQQDHDTNIEQDIEDVSQEDISYNNEESSHRNFGNQIAKKAESNNTSIWKIVPNSLHSPNQNNMTDIPVRYLLTRWWKFKMKDPQDEILLEQAQTNQNTETVSSSVAFARLLEQRETEMATDNLEEGADSGEEPFSSDDSIADPNYQSDDSTSSSSNVENHTFLRIDEPSTSTEGRAAKKKTRKRKTCPTEWKRNKIKLLRNTGQTYNTLNKGITNRCIRSVIIKRKGDLEGKRRKHGKQKQVPENLRNDVRAHIESIPKIESHYTRAHSEKQYIEGVKTITDLYRDYKTQCETEYKPFVTLTMYRYIFNYEFNLAFFVSRKDQCQRCVSYENANNDEKEELETDYLAHQSEKNLSREEKQNDKEKTSESYQVSCFDLQATLPTPRGDVSSFYYKSKLSTYNCTVCNLTKKGQGSVACFMWHEGQGKRGPNEIGVNLGVKRNQLFDFLSKEGLLSQANTIPAKQKIVDFIKLLIPSIPKEEIMAKIITFSCNFTIRWLGEIKFGAQSTQQQVATVTPTRRSVLRATKEFASTNTRPKRRRTKSLVGSHSPEELLFATQTSFIKKGQRIIAHVMKKAQ
ncbi:hypothetical protein NQ314_021135 [Rhamnusium bicolor]|uniref:PiggyBac transposable element-derived protein domain-containing protein n=1 Tax=Rhamnusium bicolor TaxID=1586634 RepID=A0AAV8WJV7_9CUCU|nr:hypothetical protein NQ314_021135 [Rhamnusium bicolor]